MKKLRLSYLLLVLVFVLLCVSCFMCASPFFREDTIQHGCKPLPEGFSTADLVGTWIAKSAALEITDTLYIRADGTYKQIIHMKIGTQGVAVDYEGDWEHWRFEPRPNGTGYLHMQGMRECAATEDPCEWINDGSAPQADVCEDQWMDPDPVGETVLVVYGYSFLDPNEEISHPFALTLFRGFEGSSWRYIFKEP